MTQSPSYFTLTFGVGPFGGESLDCYYTAVFDITTLESKYCHTLFQHDAVSFPKLIRMNGVNSLTIFDSTFQMAIYGFYEPMLTISVNYTLNFTLTVADATI